MTRHDLRIALMVAAVVVVIGLLLGYVAGTFVRAPAWGIAPPPPGETAAYDRPAAPEYQSADGGQVPGYQEIYVNDYAGLLTPAARSGIRNSLVGLYDRTGIEMTVLTIATMSDFGHYGPIEPFATRLFNTWGIGNATRNDGVLVLVARNDREMRIELGSGYAASWDKRMQRVIDTAFLPAFRRDAYEQGIVEGVDATIAELTGGNPAEMDQPPVVRGWSRIIGWLQDLGGWAVAVLAPPLAGFSMWLRRYLRRRPRRCPTCATLMQRAGEQADDEHLDGGQQLEEYLKSVDYDVWHCAGCGRIDITRHKNWFSSYGACPKCQYRTMSTTSTVLVSATTSSTGRKRLDYDCSHCGYKDSETRTIPKKSKSSSGSGRSSFGGGSSSGGGASGSW